MSRDIKYIGMDVHTEAIVIAVRNTGGKLVMESIVETKASSLLQFIHGLRGELHVTWEKAPGQPGCNDLGRRRQILGLSRKNMQGRGRLERPDIQLGEYSERGTIRCDFQSASQLWSF